MSKRVGQKQAARVVREQMARERRRRRTLWTAVIAAIVVVLAGVVGYGIYASQKPSAFNTPQRASADATGIVEGAGPVTVDVYLDFLCPHCKAFEQEANATLQRLASENKATVVYHPIAILDSASTTEYSTRSAASSGCAADQGKFVQYSTVLFDRQPAEGGPGLSDDELIQAAGSAGIVDPQFAQCVRNGTYKSWVTHTTDGASRAGVTGTPSVFVAGKQLAQPSSASITAAVDAAPK
jgi:protein-disulfide isomerase